jgi:hypothetical protein
LEVTRLELESVNKTLQSISNDLDMKRIELNKLQKVQGSRQQQIKLLSEISHPVEHDITYVFNDRYSLNPSSSSPAILQPINTNRNLSPSQFNINASHEVLIGDSTAKAKLKKQPRNGKVTSLETQLASITLRITKSTSNLLESANQIYTQLSSAYDESENQLKSKEDQATEAIEGRLI